MSDDTPTASEGQLGHDETIDRLNLQQALRDFEVANARVIDLTGRVTSLSRELLEARAQLTELQMAGPIAEERDALARELSSLKASKAFRVMRLIGGTVYRLRHG